MFPPTRVLSRILLEETNAREAGISIDADGRSVNLDLFNNQCTSNTGWRYIRRYLGSGVAAGVQNATALRIRAQDNVLAENGIRGMSFEITPGLERGAIILRNNSIFGHPTSYTPSYGSYLSVPYEFQSTSSFQVYAQYNWRGTATPTPSQFTDNIDYSNWLLSDPNL